MLVDRLRPSRQRVSLALLPPCGQARALRLKCSQWSDSNQPESPALDTTWIVFVFFKLLDNIFIVLCKNWSMLMLFDSHSLNMFTWRQLRHLAIASFFDTWSTYSGKAKNAISLFIKTKNVLYWFLIDTNSKKMLFTILCFLCGETLTFFIAYGHLSVHNAGKGLIKPTWLLLRLASNKRRS